MPARPVPPLDTTELGEALDVLTDDPSHPGIRLICHGIRLIAETTNLDEEAAQALIAGTTNFAVNATQVLLAELVGSPDGTDVLGALGHLIARLTNSDSNPALRSLPNDVQKTAQLEGERASHSLTHYALRKHPSAACAALGQ